MTTPIVTRTFSFFEETLKCKIHNEVANFFCICKIKLCSKCVSEGVHLNQHANVMIMPTKELRKMYINELEDLESLMEDMSEKRNNPNRNYSPNSKMIFKFDMQELKHFSQNFFKFIKKFYLKFIRDMFAEERKVYTEIREQIDMASKNTPKFKCEDILDFVTKSKILKEKANDCLIRKGEKVNDIQGILINRSEELESELRRFFEKFFFNTENEINTRNVRTSEETKSEEENKQEKQESFSDGDHNSFLKLLNSNINKLINESDYPNEDSRLNSINCFNSYSSEVKKLLKSRNPRKTPKNMKTSRIEERSGSEEEMVVQQSMSKSISSFDKQSELEYENPEGTCIYTLQNEDSEKDLSYDAKSHITEYSKLTQQTDTPVGLANRNRIQNMIKKKPKFENKSFCDNYNSQKKKHISYNNFATTRHYNNFNNLNDTSSNQITPTSNNAKPAYKISNQEKLCVECLLPYTPSKSNPDWKKRCLECLKTAAAKKNLSKKDISNQFSYKAGKTNQICQSCKISFVVPVSLSKQRKTCYYCFKAGKTQQEDNK